MRSLHSNLAFTAEVTEAKEEPGIDAQEREWLNAPANSNGDGMTSQGNLFVHDFVTKVPPSLGTYYHDASLPSGFCPGLHRPVVPAREWER